MKLGSPVEQTLLGMLDPDNRTWQPGTELTPSEWETMRTMALQHRLGPLLHWRLTQSAEHLNIPQSFLHAIAADFRKHTSRSLYLQYEIVRIHRVLRERGITAVFLKGAFLAFQVYPHAALRPLRDIDVLVPRQRAMEAFDALLRIGFMRTAYAPGDPAAAIDCLKHLPNLASPSTPIAVELHTRLFHPQDSPAPLQPEPADDPAVWKRLLHREMAGEQIAFLSSADQLLHLIVHAVFDHRLANGPLVLTDIAGLVKRTEIHWPTFWSTAAAGGWTRGCALLLRVADRFCGPLTFASPTFTDLPQLPEDLVTTTATLMLADYNQQPNTRLRADLLQAQSVAGRMRVLLARMFPSRRYLAATGAGAGSRPLERSSYRAHLWRLVSVRVPQYLASRDHRAVGASADLARLNRWLEQ
jgi:Uncharacterised nucleotidyltransferase